MAPEPYYLLQVLPARVRRGYTGGRLLDGIEQREVCQDSNQPESWLASLVEAKNPGLEPIAQEGLSRVVTPAGEARLISQLLAHPTHYLGAQHMETMGAELGFLAKLLDSASRLHVQAHPNRQFARQRMGQPYGKLEFYHVLSVREGVQPYIRLGFQRPPTREEWGRIIREQDVEAMDACFDPIPVVPGESWLVPGGLPHAIGPGLLLVEVMEPSDLVVRCEFECAGVKLPPGGRFMGRDLDFCLDVFDYTAYSPEAVRQRFHLEPQIIAKGESWRLERLAGAEHTDCFEVLHMVAAARGVYSPDGRCALLICTRGNVAVNVADETIELEAGGALFCAAAAKYAILEPGGAGECEVVICRPSLGSKAAQ